MTPQEQQLLTSLTQKINGTQLQEKDPDAENLLGRELGANPDALYILAQTVLVQNIALDQAKAQVAQLQQQLEQAQQSSAKPAHSTSFLGKLLGDRDPEPNQARPPQPPAYQPVPPYAQPTQYAPQPGQWQQGSPYPPQGQWQQAPGQYVPMGGGQPSFLRGAMQTAAGVAAGALAFEGVESVLHGLGGGHGGYGIGGGGFDRPEETVINNYYDGPGRGEHQGGDGGLGDGVHDRDRDRDSLAGFDGSSGDSGSGDDAASFDGSSSDNASGFDDGGQSDSGLDDSSLDDSSLDDGGGFDDGGSNDLV